MTPSEYIEAAARTLPNLPPREMLTMLTMGLAGEAMEAARTSGRWDEESGDSEWYAGNLAAFLCGASTTAVTMHEMCKPGLRIDSVAPHEDRVALAGVVLEHVKKHLFHGHELGEGFLLCVLARIWQVNAGEAIDKDSDIATVRASNIEKLKRRYPDGFSVERSRNRDTVPQPEG